MLPSPFDGTNRAIVGGPLLDLVAIQKCLTDEEITSEELWIATAKAENDLYHLQWNNDDLCEFLKILKLDDYRKSEWAKSSCNSSHACDVYVVRFDEDECQRDPHALEHYLKFSANSAGNLMIHIISCHLS